ncbi:MAG: trigger factor, partial [Candidatus Dormibacteria bacterium]
EELRRRYAQVSDASDREARRGDLVEADLTMRHRGEVVGTPDQRQSLDLEADELLPGMADQLIGARVGEQVEVTLTLPEEYGREELRGELVTITASVTQIQAKELPGLDDNLAAIAGHGDDLEGLRAYAREQLAASAQAEAEGEQEREVLERLVAISQVEVPEAMVQAEIDRQLRELELRLAAAGISLEQWLQSQDKSREQFRGEQRQPAVEQVQRDLVLEQLARREQVEVEDQELDENLRRIFSRQASRESRQRAREPLRREMRLEKARRWLAELARGESPQG